MKQIVIAILASISLSICAQNIQLHYDTRHWMNSRNENRNYITATYEMLKFDQYGSWFMFIDADFNQDKTKNNLGLMYTEISRTFNLGKCPVQAHIEFNGGQTKYGVIENAYLAGAEYPFVVGNFHLSTYLVYKLNNFEKVSHDAQWTGVWDGSVLNNKVTLSGFIDIWSENKDRMNGLGGKKTILMTEPQVWYNFNKKFSLGSEVEITKNFYPYTTDLLVYPTLAVKYVIE